MKPLTRARTPAEVARVEYPGDRRRRARASGRDRRSAHRPHFVDGWRKSIGTQPHRPSADTTSNARIDVWLIDTEALLKAHSCLTLLTADDWATLTRLQDPRVRYSAMAARIVLRLALSRAVDRRVTPSAWQFGTTEHDKPIITGPLPGINFTVSHVDQLTAVAVAHGVNLGIDIECVDREVSNKVIDGFCHPDERRSLQGLTGTQRFREFIRLWTLKEAYSKLVGLGHSLDFREIKCPIAPIEHGNVEAGVIAPAQFEKFFVSVGHTLFHAAIAIERHSDAALAAELQIINLAPSQTEHTEFSNASCG